MHDSLQSMNLRFLAVFACVIAALGCSSPTGAATVHHGLTAPELIEFAQNEGWTARFETNLKKVVTIEIASRKVTIEFLDCDAKDRCMSGVIRDITYYSLKPESSGFWHWNLKGLGATGFGPSYVTLQRYLHFNGVTDVYLRDVISRIWPKAAASFWEDVRRRYDNGRKAR